MPFLTLKQLQDDLASDRQIISYISDRGGRKSSCIQLELIDRAIKEHTPFIVIRSKITNSINENWMSKYVLDMYSTLGYTFDTIKIYGIRFYMTATYCTTPNDDRVLLWYGMYLSQAQACKSNYFDGWDKVSAIVWEECIPQEKLPQNPKVFDNYVDMDFYNLLSIRSTVVRDRKVPLIILGNDIEHNILNTITVKFNLLERLSANCLIDDKCFIDGRYYTFRFRYFDFDGAVNHWLEAIDKKLSQSVDTSRADNLDIILKTEYNTYYIYKLSAYYYISTNPPKDKECITNSLEWFFSNGWEHLYTDDVALLPSRFNYILQFTPELKDSIVCYFGDNWMFSPRFRQKADRDYTVIDMTKLNKLTIQEQLDSPLWDQYTTLFSILHTSVVIYSNIAIKWACEQFEQNNLTLMLSLNIK